MFLKLIFPQHVWTSRYYKGSVFTYDAVLGEKLIKSIISVTCQQPCSDICLIMWLTRKIFLLGLNNSEKIFYNVSFDAYQLKDQSCFVLCLTFSLVKSQHNKTNGLCDIYLPWANSSQAPYWKKSSMYLYSLQHALPLSCDKEKFFTDWCHFHISLVFF